jgi:hypothetical protein
MSAPCLFYSSKMILIVLSLFNKIDLPVLNSISLIKLSSNIFA